jgi:hypothetical protein
LLQAVQGHASVSALREPGSSAAAAPEERTASVAPRVWIDLHVGRHIFIENSYSRSHSKLRYAFVHPRSDSSVTLLGSLDAKQFTGGMRARLPWLPAGSTAFSARVGYGWTWYTLDGVQVNGEPFGGQTRGGYGPPLLPSARSWPNMAYGGLAIEYFSPRDRWLAGRLGFGVRATVDGQLQRLSATEVSSTHGIWVGRGDVALALTLGW